MLKNGNPRPERRHLVSYYYYDYYSGTTGTLTLCLSPVMAAYVAESDTRANYEALEALDKVLEYPEIHVTYK